MGSVEDIQLDIKEPQGPTNGTILLTNASSTDRERLSRPINCRRWVPVSLYTVCLLVSQCGATLLGRFYYDNGGKSKWIATLVYSAGFPLAIPFLIFSSRRSSSSTCSPSNNTKTSPCSILLLALTYIGFGVLISVENWMYAYGLLNLPVSTYSLLCTTELAFNALFSYFLSSQRFTSYVLNSVVLLTISASILATHTEGTGPSNVSKTNHIAGFLVTIGASALYSLGLSLAQLRFDKVLMKNSNRLVLEMRIYPAIVATSICIGGVFVSKEWRGLKGEMEEFKTGKVSYLMTVFWTAVLWELFSVSCLGLVYEASSLLSSVISTVALPVVPILAVVLFKDKMDGMKIVALVLAFWGFISYIYQHYLDNFKSKTTTTTTVTDKNDVFGNFKSNATTK